MSSLNRVFTRADEVPGNLLSDAREMPQPRGVLLCPPDYFSVIDVKNPFMEGQIGKVDARRARQQWEQLREALRALPLEVHTVAALPGCEDMVFAANQTFVGLDAQGGKVCVPSRMTHPSRRREVPAFVEWFGKRTYRTVELAGSGHFEGGGDALWHPGRAVIWGGHGPRSQDEAYPELAQAFDAPVMLLDLITERFYHLDTCFCPLNEELVLIYPSAFSADSLALIHRVFPRVVEAGDRDAGELMACNAAPFLSRYVVIQRGADATRRRLETSGFEVIEVETGEFMKSGGSVFCMKMSFWLS